MLHLFYLYYFSIASWYPLSLYGCHETDQKSMLCSKYYSNAYDCKFWTTKHQILISTVHGATIVFLAVSILCHEDFCSFAVSHCIR